MGAGGLDELAKMFEGSGMDAGSMEEMAKLAGMAAPDDMASAMQEMKDALANGSDADKRAMRAELSKMLPAGMDLQQAMRELDRSGGSLGPQEREAMEALKKLLA